MLGSLVGIQALTRLSSFAVHQALLRRNPHVTPALLGLAHVQMELVLALCRHLPRDGLRFALVRADGAAAAAAVPSSATTTGSASMTGPGRYTYGYGLLDGQQRRPARHLAQLRWVKLVNVVWAVVSVLGLACLTLALTLFYLPTLDWHQLLHRLPLRGGRMTAPAPAAAAAAAVTPVQWAVLGYALAGAGELAHEPMYALTQRLRWMRARVTVEAVAVTGRAAALYVLAMRVFAPPGSASVAADGAVLAFAAAQLLHTGLLWVGYAVCFTLLLVWPTATSSALPSTSSALSPTSSALPSTSSALHPTSSTSTASESASASKSASESGGHRSWRMHRWLLGWLRRWLRRWLPTEATAEAVPFRGVRCLWPQRILVLPSGMEVLEGHLAVAAADAPPPPPPTTSTRSPHYRHHYSYYYYLDPHLLGATAARTKQAVVKQLLAEGDKLVLACAASLYDQGVYATVANYASLVARCVLQPMEEATRLGLATGTAGTRTAAVARVLRVTRTVFLCGVVGAATARAYTGLLLDCLLGAAWSRATTAPTLLAAYALYLPLCAVNGLTEAVLASVGAEAHLARSGRWMVLCTLGYLLAGCSLVPLLTRLAIGPAHSLGAVALIALNGGHMLMRTWYTLRMIRHAMLAAHQAVPSPTPSPGQPGYRPRLDTLPTEVDLGFDATSPPQVPQQWQSFTDAARQGANRRRAHSMDPGRAAPPRDGVQPVVVGARRVRGRASAGPQLPPPVEAGPDIAQVWTHAELDPYSTGEAEGEAYRETSPTSPAEERMRMAGASLQQEPRRPRTRHRIRLIRRRRRHIFGPRDVLSVYYYSAYLFLQTKAVKLYHDLFPQLPQPNVCSMHPDEVRLDQMCGIVRLLCPSRRLVGSVLLSLWITTLSERIIGWATWPTKLMHLAVGGASFLFQLSILAGEDDTLCEYLRNTFAHFLPHLSHPGKSKDT